MVRYAVAYAIVTLWSEGGRPSDGLACAEKDSKKGRVV